MPISASTSVSMREDFFRQVALLERIDLVLVPGDLTSIACPDEFDIASSFLNELKSRLKSKPEIVHTYGNHDVSWSIEELSPLVDGKPKIPGYLKVASTIGQICHPYDGFSFRGPVSGSGYLKNKTFDLLVLNSSTECFKHAPIKNGKVGAEQRKWLDETLKSLSNGSEKWRIVMVHHHPYQLSYPTAMPDYSAIEDGDEVLSILGKYGVDMVLHGHRHHPTYQTLTKNGWAAPITVFCAGSFGVDVEHRANGQLDNTFHIIDFESRHEKTRACVGSIRTFYFSLNGWKESIPDSGQDYEDARGSMTSPQYFGSVAYEGERQQLLLKLVHSHLAPTQSGPPSSIISLPSKDALHHDLRSTKTKELNFVLQGICASNNLELICEFGANGQAPKIIRKP